MTVESTDRKQTYAGGQSAHTFTFKALTTAPEDIKCLKTLISTGAETDLTYDVDYTVDLEDDGIGGVVTLNPTCSTLYTVTVYRVTTDKQESDYDDYNQFPADTLEGDLDRRTMISQERGEDSDRTLKLSISTSGVTTTLPTPVADQVLGWNSAGTAIENKDLTDLGTIVVDTDTTLAANSDAKVASQKATKTYADTKVKGDGTVNPTNLISNGDFESWSAGASAAPDGWGLSGAGASVAREGTIIKTGTYSSKLTRSGTNCYLYQEFYADKGLAYWKGRTVTCGMWVYATVASTTRINISDGVLESFSSYHTGGSAWEWLTVTHSISSTASDLQLNTYIESSDTSSYFDGAMLVEGTSAFAFSPKPAEEGVWADYSAVSTVEGWASFTEKIIMTKKIGKTVVGTFSILGVSNQTYARFTVPYVSASTVVHFGGALNEAYNNGSILTTAARWEIADNSSTVNLYKDMAGAAWTNANAKNVRGNFWYESA